MWTYETSVEWNGGKQGVAKSNGKPEMGVPSTRLEINEHFKQQPEHAGLNSREVLATILRDQHAGARGSPFKQRVAGRADVAVYKAGFIDGLLGRPGFEIQPVKTVTLKLAGASSSSA